MSRLYREYAVALYAAICLVLLLLPTASTAAFEQGIVPPTIYVARYMNYDFPNRILMQTLQGLVNKDYPRLFFDTGGTQTTVLNQIKAEGTVAVTQNDVWQLVNIFRSRISGVIVYNQGDESINVATSLCGPWNCVAVDESLLTKAQQEGLTVVYDARGKTEQQTWDTYKNLFSKGLVIEHNPTYAHFRDYAVSMNAFVFYTTDSGFTQQVASYAGPNAIMYGWGPDEWTWFRDAAEGTASAVAANNCLNTSVHRWLGIGGNEQKPRSAPTPAANGQRIVSFVLSDGDNLSWVTNSVPLDWSTFANALRGTFNMTWEIPPTIADLAPRILQDMYDRAYNGPYKDCFITGGTGLGTAFPKYYNDMTGLAAKTAQYMVQADLKVVSILNDNGDDLDCSAKFLDRPEVMGVVYKDYSPYSRHNGEIYWRNGKPCVSYKFSLWENYGDDKTPDGVAAAIADMPNNPLTNQGSYAMIIVHAWSWDDIGGPMQAIKKTIDRLPPNTRVVTAEDLIALLRQNFGTPVVFDTTPPTVPGTPTSGVTCTKTPFIWTWTASTDSGGIKQYQVRVRDGAGVIYDGYVTANSFSYSSIASGNSYALIVRAQDNAGNWGDWSNYSAWTLYDTEAPVMSAAPSAAAAWSTNGSVTFTWPAAADTGGSGVANYFIHIWRTDIPWGSPGADCWSGLIGNTTNYTYSGGQNGITYKAYVYAIDNADNWGTTAQWSDGCSVDTLLPIPGTASAPQSVYTGNIPVSYSGAGDSPSGLVSVHLWYKRQDTGWVDSGMSSTSASGTFDFNPLSGGTYNFALRALDTAGNWSGVPSGSGDCATIYLNDTTAPAGAIEIESGELYATSASVSLAIHATDEYGVTEMRISNDGANWGAWEPYATTKQWTLLPGTGIRNVYAQFKDAAGYLSAIASDSVYVGVPVSIPEAKLKPYGMVILADVIVSAQFGDHAYVQSGYPLSGVKVVGGLNDAEGAVVDLVGNVELSGGEKTIRLIDKKVKAASGIEPLLINIRYIGGGDWRYAPAE